MHSSLHAPSLTYIYIHISNNGRDARGCGKITLFTRYTTVASAWPSSCTCRALRPGACASKGILFTKIVSCIQWYKQRVVYNIPYRRARAWPGLEIGQKNTLEHAFRAIIVSNLSKHIWYTRDTIKLWKLPGANCDHRHKPKYVSQPSRCFISRHN